jgi:thioredoxin 1
MVTSDGYKVYELTGAGVDNALASPAALLYFFVEWIGPCQQMGSVLDELAREWGPLGLPFYKIDLDVLEAKATTLGVRRAPCILLVKGGELAGRIDGFVSKEKVSVIIGSLFPSNT